jgi:hypothetical protein
MANAHSIALLAVAGALVAGCGGSGGARLSAGQLAAQGTAICRQAGAAERAVAGPNAVSALPPIVTRELAQLDKLSPPAGEQGSYATLLEDFSQLNTLLQSLSSTIARTGKAPAEILSRGREVAARAAAVAGPLGLAACTAPH